MNQIQPVKISFAKICLGNQLHFNLSANYNIDGNNDSFHGKQCFGGGCCKKDILSHLNLSIKRQPAQHANTFLDCRSGYICCFVNNLGGIHLPVTRNSKYCFSRIFKVWQVKEATEKTISKMIACKIPTKKNPKHHECTTYYVIILLTCLHQNYVIHPAGPEMADASTVQATHVICNHFPE